MDRTLTSKPIWHCWSVDRCRQHLAGATKGQGDYSPFNVMNWLLELLNLSPTLVAYVWRENGVENPYKLADLRLRSAPFPL